MANGYFPVHPPRPPIEASVEMAEHLAPSRGSCGGVWRRRSVGAGQTPALPPAGTRRGAAGPAARMRACSTGSSTLFARVRAGSWWCAASRAWARRRCWTTWSSTRRAAGWRAPPVSSRRWSSRSPGCTSCARRCWTASSVSRLRSALRCGPRSASVPGRRRTASWSALAVLSLLSEVAEEQPLICLVDDEQWLDRASAQVLGFVARRLAAESVGLVFAARVPSDELAGLPELVVEGLQEADARALLDAVLTGPLDARVRDQIVAETRGNPLALLELPRGLTPAELAGGFALPGAMPLSGRIEESFRRRLDALPADTRRLLQLAAADPVGDPVLVWRAAERLGIATEAATPAAEAGLLEFGARVRFRHPLVRSAAYRSASLQERQDVHRALARGHRSADRSRPPRLAPGPGRARARRGRRRRARALGRPGAGARRPGRGGRVPGARGDADARTRSPCPAPARGGQGQARRRRAGRGTGTAGRGRGRAARRAADRRGGAPARTDRVGAARRQRRCSAAAQRGQAPGAARRRPGPRDAPGGARGRDLGRRPGQPRRRAWRRPRPRAPRPPVPNRRVRSTSCSTRSRCG